MNVVVCFCNEIETQHVGNYFVIKLNLRNFAGASGKSLKRTLHKLSRKLASLCRENL